MHREDCGERGVGSGGNSPGSTHCLRLHTDSARFICACLLQMESTPWGWQRQAPGLNPSYWVDNFSPSSMTCLTLVNLISTNPPTAMPWTARRIILLYTRRGRQLYHKAWPLVFMGVKLPYICNHRRPTNGVQLQVQKRRRLNFQPQDSKTASPSTHRRAWSFHSVHIIGWGDLLYSLCCQMLVSSRHTLQTLPKSQVAKHKGTRSLA